MKKITKTIKIQTIVNITDKDEKTKSYDLLRSWFDLGYKYANETVQIYYTTDLIRKFKLLQSEPQRLSDVYNHDPNQLSRKEQNQIINQYVSDVQKIDVDGILSSNPNVSERNLAYNTLTTAFKDRLPSNIRAEISSRVFKNYKSARFQILKGQRTLQTYKEGMPTYFMGAMISKLSKTNDEFSFNFTTEIPMKTMLGKKPSNPKSVLQKIFDKEYQLIGSSYVIKDSKIFFFLTYTFEKNNDQYRLDPNTVVGVDMGIIYPAYCAIPGTMQRLSVSTKQEIFGKRLQFKRQLESAQKSAINGAGGRGRKHKLKSLNRINDKEHDYINTKYHTISKQIVDFAIQNKAGQINMEDLSNIGKNDEGNIVDDKKILIRNWGYYGLQSKIKTKAEAVGITVKFIDPSYTSQTCSQCGHQSRDNRTTQDKFKCTECEYETNADYNAAINIGKSTKYTDETPKVKIKSKTQKIAKTPIDNPGENQTKKRNRIKKEREEKTTIPPPLPKKIKKTK